MNFCMKNKSLNIDEFKFSWFSLFVPFLGGDFSKHTYALLCEVIIIKYLWKMTKVFHGEIVQVNSFFFDQMSSKNNHRRKKPHANIYHRIMVRGSDLTI